MRGRPSLFCFFFFNDTATTEIYTLSLHDALPIWGSAWRRCPAASRSCASRTSPRSEEHTSELQSPKDLVCRLLLEKKKKTVRSDRNATRIGSKTRHGGRKENS